MPDWLSPDLAPLKGHPLWNGQVKALQVTDASERTQLRVLVAADSAPQAWDLRCLVREKLIAYLQSLDGGRYLPRQRWERVPEAVA